MKTEKNSFFFVFPQEKNSSFSVTALAYSNPQRVFFPGCFSDLPHS